MNCYCYGDDISSCEEKEKTTAFYSRHAQVSLHGLYTVRPPLNIFPKPYCGFMVILVVVPDGGASVRIVNFSSV